jgi:condensin complex subunit 1
MCINAEYCQNNLRLLFTVLKKHPDPRVRANIVIALGDLAFRFPNTLEPWSDSMYAVLKDPVTTVRKNALMMLSHLILNDMIKIKGSIADVALCLEDGDARIVELTRMFFQELAGKGENPVYNLLPDIISRLSNESVAEDAFQRVLKFLMSYIQKERQVDNLVEKLCARFDTKEAGRHARDVSFCLAQLSYSDKALKKLTELFKSYKDALGDVAVYENLSSIVARTRKAATIKAESKTMLDDLEAKLNSAHERLTQDSRTTRQAATVRGKFDNVDLDDDGKQTRWRRSEGRAANVVPAGARARRRSREQGARPACGGRAGRSVGQGRSRTRTGSRSVARRQGPRGA